MNTRYAIITPVRDEQEHIESTLRSVASQTVPPQEWIIVDDGSQDDTAAIVQRFAETHPWIRLVRREDRGFRHSGRGVVEAFNQGLARIEKPDWQFLVKLDGDLGLTADYFARLFEEFNANPRLGIAGGVLYSERNGVLAAEECPQFHVRGATKVYRRACWDDIGGLISSPGWDIVDECKANMCGWATRSLPGLTVIHHRPTGTAESKWKDQLKNGRAYFVAGYHPIFLFAKCVYRLASKPYVVGALGIAWGYISASVRKVPSQVNDPQLVRYVRRQQLRKLAGLSTIWK